LNENALKIFLSLLELVVTIYKYKTSATRRFLNNFQNMNEPLFSSGGNVYTERGANAGEGGGAQLITVVYSS
jgi:hypothetical protein